MFDHMSTVERYRNKFNILANQYRLLTNTMPYVHPKSTHKQRWYKPLTRELNDQITITNYIIRMEIVEENQYVIYVNTNSSFYVFTKQRAATISLS